MSKDDASHAAPSRLQRLIDAARIEHPCSQGHDWQSVGGRPCEKSAEGCQGSQTVYECQRCGQYDYGEPGSLGHADCVLYCGATA